MFMLCFVLIGVGRLNVQQDGFVRQLHFTTHTQNQTQSFFLFVDVVVRLCPQSVSQILAYFTLRKRVF